jgi:hypothetical protein
MSIVSPAESFVILGKCAKWVSSEHGVGTRQRDIWGSRLSSQNRPHHDGVRSRLVVNILPYSYCRRRRRSCSGVLGLWTFSEALLTC